MSERYLSVVDFARAELGDDFADSLQRQIEQRGFVRNVAICRTFNDWTEDELGRRTGITGERVREIECGHDVDVTPREYESLRSVLHKVVLDKVNPSGDP